MHEPGHPFVEKGCLQLDPEEFGIMQVERMIQVAFHRGQIDAVVFNAGMVAHHGEAEHREKQDQH
jgi:hypothetical protein